MAFSWQSQTYPAGTSVVNVDVEYLEKSYIYVYLDNVLTTEYSWVSDTLIQLNSALTAPTEVLIIRRTDKEFLYIMFAEGAAFIRENIDTQNTQFLHLAQELTEGRSIEGFYGDLNMNGYKITNLAPGTAPTDAVNKGQLDVVDNRVSALENAVSVDTISLPWFYITETETDTISPGREFTAATLELNGVGQVPGYSYQVVNNQIILAKPVPAGTMVYARLGGDVNTILEEYATKADLAALQTLVDAKASAGVNTDITTLDNLTGGIKGITSAQASAPVGYIGDIREAVGTTQTINNAATVTMSILPLPAGVWEVCGFLQLTPAADTSISSLDVGISTTSGMPTNWYNRLKVTSFSSGLPLPSNYVLPSIMVASNSASNPRVILQCVVTGTLTGQAYIRARRTR